VAKPDPAIFRIALRALGASANAVVHVGDDPIADVQGARATGLRAVLVRRTGTPTSGAARDPVWPDVPVIRTLRELTHALDD